MAMSASVTLLNVHDMYASKLALHEIEKYKATLSLDVSLAMLIYLSALQLLPVTT
jgi:hypothetical protein